MPIKKLVRFLAFININFVVLYFFFGGLNEGISAELVAYNQAYHSELIKSSTRLFSIFIVASSLLYILSLIGMLIDISSAKILFIFGIISCYSLKFLLGPYVEHPINTGLNSVSMLIDGIIFGFLLVEKFELKAGVEKEKDEKSAKMTKNVIRKNNANR